MYLQHLYYKHLDSRVALVDMNSIYILSLIKLCVQSLSRSLSESIVIWFPLHNMSVIIVGVRTQCEWDWYWLSGCT